MPDLSCRGKALSRGMSSVTMARGWPSTTEAARHTCLIRGPPARRNSWHSGEMSCGWEENSGMIELDTFKTDRCLSLSGVLIRGLTCPWTCSVLTGTSGRGTCALCFLLCLLKAISWDLEPAGPDNSYGKNKIKKQDICSNKGQSFVCFC